jgi:hypothetical protein
MLAYSLIACKVAFSISSCFIQLIKDTVITPVAQRICQMCNLNQIECEKHFILLCPSYQEYRIKQFVNMRIDSWLLEGEVQIVFKNIMCSRNEQVIFKLGKYIQK